MAGQWFVAVYVLFPVPLVCLLLLCLPLPKQLAFVRKYVLFIVDKILFGRLSGGLNLYRVCMVLSSLLFIGSTWEVVRAEQRFEASKILIRQEDQKYLCYKWRADRNFWISFFSLVLWLVLYRVHHMTKELETAYAALKTTEQGKNE